MITLTSPRIYSRVRKLIICLLCRVNWLRCLVHSRMRTGACWWRQPFCQLPPLPLFLFHVAVLRYSGARIGGGINLNQPFIYSGELRRFPVEKAMICVLRTREFQFQSNAANIANTLRFLCTKNFRFCTKRCPEEKLLIFFELYEKNSCRWSRGSTPHVELCRKWWLN